MTKFKPQSFTLTDEISEKIKEISKLIGDAGVSATVRYCVACTYNSLLKDRQ